MIMSNISAFQYPGKKNKNKKMYFFIANFLIKVKKFVFSIRATNSAYNNNTI
jgi:hypothetical protein